MKIKLYLVLLVAILFSLCAEAQTNVTLSSQIDVNSYQSNYGLSDIPSVLTISGADITDLTPLSGITSVGSLFIINNANLESLHGLETINTVGVACQCAQPGLILDSNPKIANLDGLSGITTIESMVKIANNFALANINGLSHVTRIGDGVAYALPGILVQDNPLLTDLAGFSNVSGTVGEVRIINNNALTNLDGLHKVTSIAGYGLAVTDNNSLTDISGLSNVTYIGRALNISSNAVLPNLNGLQSLREIVIVRGGGIGIAVSNNPALTDIDSLSNLSSIHGPITIVDFSNDGNLNRGCGLFPLLTEYARVCPNCTLNSDFSGSGITKEGILAGGPCGTVTCNGDITLSSQAEVDAFATTHGCTVINGTLLISGPDITNLDGLNGVTKALGLEVRYSHQLTDISGLSNLKEVDALSIINNPALTSLVGLSSLTTVHESLMLSSNTGLKNLHGLESLTTLKDLFIYNQIMDDLSGMDGVTSIPRTFTMSFNSLKSLGGLKVTSIGKFTLSYDSALTTLEGLSGVQTIAALEVDYNQKLQTFGIHSLQSTGDFIVIGNPSLLNFDGLTSLTTVGHLQISENNSVQSIGGFSALTTITRDGIVLSRNPQLQSLSGLDHVSTVPGKVTISDNDALRNLNGLGATSVGSLSVGDNESLESFDGVDNLARIASACGCPWGGLQIYNNPNLTNINGLAKLTSIASELSISRNPKLENIDALSSVTSVGRNTDFGDASIVIDQNTVLKSINGLRNVPGVRGGVFITYNDSLKNLDGLEKLTHTGGYGLDIMNNKSLENIDALSNLVEALGEISVVNNPKLKNLNGFASLTTLTGVRGNTAKLDISSNPMLTNVDSLGKFTTMTGIKNELIVTHNPNLIKGCGLYPVLHNTNPQATFSDNGAGVTRDEILADGPCDGSNSTTDPTAATNMMFANVTDNSMDVSFHAGANATGYITIMRSFESGLPDAAPVDGTQYHIGNVIGCCTIVVGMGMDTTLHIIYQEPDIEYYFDVIPFTSNYDYKTELALSGHQRTLPQSQPYPNPFVEELVIPVTVTDENTTVKILITDQLGRPVSEIVKMLDNSGRHEITWNRADSYGNRVVNGVYTYSISTPNNSVKGLVMAK